LVRGEDKERVKKFFEKDDIKEKARREQKGNSEMGRDLERD
jgi:hypothetical protein